MSKLNSQQMKRLAVGMVAIAIISTSASAQSTIRASLAWNGDQGNGNSPDVAGAKISRDGRFVAFKSLATNLVSGGTNGHSQIFLRDLLLNTTILVSVDPLGMQGNGDSFNPSVSADGRYVAFTSYSTNLAMAGMIGLEFNQKNVYERDTLLNTTLLVSTGFGVAAPNGDSDSSAVSDDGSVVAFRSLSTNLTATPTTGSQVFSRDLYSGVTTLDSMSLAGQSGNGVSGNLQQAISANGRYVGFSSDSTNLVSGDTNGKLDVFVRDRWTSTTRRISVASANVQANDTSYSCAMSGDGRYVAFVSYATGLVKNDKNGARDIFVRDIIGNTTVIASLAANGRQANADSGDGQGWGLGISDDGKRVAFVTIATNMGPVDVNGVKDIFVRNLATNTTTLMSTNAAGRTGNGVSGNPSLSGNGLKCSFYSAASDLVLGDTNGFEDVFVRG